jgi:hypothetical protein
MALGHEVSCSGLALPQNICLRRPGKGASSGSCRPYRLHEHRLSCPRRRDPRGRLARASCLRTKFDRVHTRRATNQSGAINGGDDSRDDASTLTGRAWRVHRWLVRGLVSGCPWVRRREAARCPTADASIAIHGNRRHRLSKLGRRVDPVTHSDARRATTTRRIGAVPRRDIQLLPDATRNLLVPRRRTAVALARLHSTARRRRWPIDTAAGALANHRLSDRVATV